MHNPFCIHLPSGGVTEVCLSSLVTVSSSQFFSTVNGTRVFSPTGQTSLLSPSEYSMQYLFSQGKEMRVRESKQLCPGTLGLGWGLGHTHASAPYPHWESGIDSVATRPGLAIWRRFSACSHPQDLSKGYELGREETCLSTTFCWVSVLNTDTVP